MKETRETRRGSKEPENTKEPGSERPQDQVELKESVKPK